MADKTDLAEGRRIARDLHNQMTDSYRPGKAQDVPIRAFQSNSNTRILLENKLREKFPNQVYREYGDKNAKGLGGAFSVSDSQGRDYDGQKIDNDTGKFADSSVEPSDPNKYGR